MTGLPRAAEIPLQRETIADSQEPNPANDFDAPVNCCWTQGQEGPGHLGASERTDYQRCTPAQIPSQGNGFWLHYGELYDRRRIEIGRALSAHRAEVEQGSGKALSCL